MTASSDEKLLKNQILTSLGPTPDTWNEVKFGEIAKNSFSLTLVYQRIPSNLQQVENDTNRIARVVIKVLVRNGRSPQRDMIGVHVHAQIPEKGETGADLVRYFGKTSYNSNNDQLEFEPCTSIFSC